MDQVLVADDGSEAALKAVETAAELAAKMGASLTAIAVSDTGAEYLERCAAIAQRHGIAHLQTERRKSDDPAQEIINFARDHQMDLIVVGSRGLGKRAGAMLGSVSQSLASSALGSVLIVR